MTRIRQRKFIGRPNPEVEIPPELSGAFDEKVNRIRGRDLASDLPRIACWPDSGDQDVYVIRLALGGLVFVRGQIVEFVDGRRLDEQQELAQFAQDAFRKQRPRMNVFGSDDCRPCTAQDEMGELWRCPCDMDSNGPDLRQWNYETTLFANNCYSFARRMRWCGSSEGSEPGGRMNRSGAEILEGLEMDGLRCVSRDTVLTATGDFIAVFTRPRGADFHFARLDGDRWCHKPGLCPAVACDADGQPIRRDGLEAASMIPGMTLSGYFEVPAGVRLSHCF